MANTIYENVSIHVKPMQEEVKVDITKRGITETKNVSLDALLECFGKSQSPSEAIYSGFLPENCLSVNIRDNSKSVVIWHPLLHCDYAYYKTVYENFPIPRMVFGFDINPKGRVEGYRMAVVDDEKPKPGTKLYEYPFSNVYSDTRICVGAANSLPTYERLYTLASLPNLILSLPNNDHNFSCTNNRLKLGYRELLDHMRDKPSSYYYEKVLIPRKDEMTLADFIQK